MRPKPHFRVEMLSSAFGVEDPAREGRTGHTPPRSLLCPEQLHPRSRPAAAGMNVASVKGHSRLCLPPCQCPVPWERKSHRRGQGVSKESCGHPPTVDPHLVAIFLLSSFHHWGSAPALLRKPCLQQALGQTCKAPDTSECQFPDLL